MNIICAEPIANIIESTGFLMVLSIVMGFIIIAGCLCLKLYGRVFAKQGSEKEGIDHISLNTLEHTLKPSPKKF